MGPGELSGGRGLECRFAHGIPVFDRGRGRRRSTGCAGCAFGDHSRQSARQIHRLHGRLLGDRFRNFRNDRLFRAAARGVALGVCRGRPAFARRVLGPPQFAGIAALARGPWPLRRGRGGDGQDRSRCRDSRRSKASSAQAVSHRDHARDTQSARRIACLERGLGEKRYGFLRCSAFTV